MNDFCYVCYETENKHNKFLKPNICKCKNLRIHKTCFMKLSSFTFCSICKYHYSDILVKQNKETIHIIGYGYYEKYTVNRKNKINGLYVSYHPNGQVLNIVQYKNNKKHGLTKTFYDNGNVKETGFYKDDLLNGIYHTYYNEALPKEYISYNKGLLHGIYIKKYINGNVMLSTTYYNDKLDGNFTYVHLNGDLCISANYSEDLLDGRFRAWELDYKLIQDRIYKKGEFVKENENFEYYIEIFTKIHLVILFLILTILYLLIHIFLF